MSKFTDIEFRVFVEGLRGGDVMSPPDPMVIMKESRQGSWMELGRTEKAKDKREHSFEQSLFASLAFGSIQKVKFDVYDCDHDKPNELLGTTNELNLATLVRKSHMSLPLFDSSNKQLKSTLTFDAEEVSDDKRVMTWTVSGKDLPGKDKFGMASDTKVFFKRQSGDSGQMVTVHTLPVCDTSKGSKGKNPTWPQEEVKLDTLFKGNDYTSLQVEVYDEDQGNDDDYMCEGSFNLNSLNKGGKHTFELDLTDKQSKKPKKAGMLMFEYEIRQTYGWTQYVKAGTEIQVLFFVDFTQSNGDDIRAPDSLHFDSPKNAYLRAAEGVYRAVQPYDSDGRVAAFGYGAKLPGAKQMTPVFNLDYEAKFPEVEGFSGFRKAYSKARDNVRFYGPTLGQPICQMAMNLAAEREMYPTTRKYTIAVILTDGGFTDIGEMTKEIIQSSKIPLSYIIVGVGSGDGDSGWSAMEFLDGDAQPLVDPSNSNNKSERDIVQFVEFEKFNGDSYALASEVLGEIPEQMETYFQNRALVPGQGISK